MNSVEIITELIIGVCLLYSGFQIGWKQNIKFINPYHLSNIDDKDFKPFMRAMGISGLIVAGGIIIMPLLNMFIGHFVGYYLGGALILCGFVMSCLIIKKYNGSLAKHKKDKKSDEEICKDEENRENK